MRCGYVVAVVRGRLCEAVVRGGCVGGCFAALLRGAVVRRRLRGAGRLRGVGRVGDGFREGGCVGRTHRKKQPREFSQTPGVNDVCQFMASISGVDIVCDDYMAK